MNEEPRVLIETDVEIDGLVILTLNRPQKKNALDQQMVDALHQAMETLESDPTIRCLIVRGAGDAFVAGADIAQLRERRAADAHEGVNQKIFRRIAEFPAPTIAAVHGWALGGGCELAIACDLRVCSEDARFGQPEVALGIIPAAGGTHRLARLIGLGHARELIFTGRIIDAEEALRLGLVNRVASPELWLQEAKKLARKICKNASGAVRLAKSAVNQAADLDETQRDQLECRYQAICFESPEKMERMTAFLEKPKKKRSNP
ncbi:MAG: enoyl-CoA hydratase-related protein [Planctomycetota bacterium]|nr:enoyl-CoA hydratase-related protein [Planctomycetota bacterium]